MSKQEIKNLPSKIKNLLKAGEWNDVEFKKARTAVPKSAFETVSAFANTHGGWLIFGISQHGEEFDIVGVEKPDKVQNDFLSVLHADQKVNHDLQVMEQRHDIEGKTVLTFRIAENPRTRKPVYLDGDIRRTFLRKGGGDYRAQMQDIERMLRDATADRWDSQPFERVDIEEVFNPSSLRWYRDRFHAVNDGFDPQQPDMDFLYDWGYLIKDGARFTPTRAAVMLFGSLRGIRNLIPRPVVDVQFLGYATDEPMPETRWIDRFVSEENIIQSWLQLVAKYKFFMPRPFRDIDPVTLGRRDDPPGFRVFREAAINLLIHQDYGDHSRKAVIKFFRDGIQFWNPGDVFGDDTRLFEPGEKEVRNPAIATAMRRIAMCEQAGTGMRMMREEWQRLGHPAPTYKNDRSWKAFELFIPELDKEVDMASDLVKAMFGDTRQSEAQEAQVAGEVADEVCPKSVPSLSQVCPKSVPSDIFIPLLEVAGDPVPIDGLMKVAGQTNRTRFRKTILRPLLDTGFIEMTIPDKPRSSKQKYRLTPKGRKLIQNSRFKIEGIMARFERFEDMEIWQQARGITRTIYFQSQQGGFARDFGLRDQIRRAAVSIMSNIAEGFERGTNKEFIQFLYIAKGSAGEVRSQLYVAFDLGYIEKDTFDKLNSDLISISRQISGFIQYLRSSGLKGQKR